MKDQKAKMTKGDKNPFIGIEKKDPLLRSLLNDSADLFLILDRELSCRYANEAFRGFFSIQLKDALDTTLEKLIPEKLAEKIERESRKVLDTGLPAEDEEGLEMSGNKRWWHILGRPVYETKKVAAGVLWRLRDITEFKLLKSRLVQLQKLESMGPLAAGIAHEINTPLGIILGYSQLLKEEAGERDTIYEGLEVIENQAKVCRKIVADLLRFSRQTESNLALIDLNQTIEEVVSVVEHLFDQENVIVKKRYSPEEILIRADRDKLKQVLMNLLSNARDAIDGKGAITVGTEIRRDNKEVEISVSDTGAGISPDILDRIFDPFFTTKSVGSGTGLGLSVSFSIIQELGGRIEVQSPPWSRGGEEVLEAKGTLFIIRLPFSDENPENIPKE